MLTAIASIFFLLIISAFFSAAETSLTAVSRPLMHQLEQDGDKRAAIVNRMLASKERLLGGLLLGNNLVNILASAMATSALIELAGEAGIVYATAVMTVVVVVYGEVLPKTYAIHNADRVALSFAPMVRVLLIILGPAIRILQTISRLMMRLIGMKYATDRDSETMLIELRGAIELHSGAGVRHERAMLRSILDLANVTVGEVMTHRRKIAAFDIAQPQRTIIDQILASPYTRVPLWRDDSDNIVGVVHAKELLKAFTANDGNADSIDLDAIAVTPWFIPDTTSLLDQLQAFRARREHFALVVDEYGTLMGVVTLEDILEEIVGDIADEHDVASIGIRQLEDGSFIVSGQVTIRDINRQMEWRLPDENAVTVAGLVLHEARHIPDKGQVFLFHGFRFEILRRVRNQIAALRVTPPQTETPLDPEARN
jgi:Mg2+/Co2+ transporter CorB